MSRVKEFTLPDLGEGLTEGEILKWLVAVGDSIELNQPIVEVETAKAAVEIPAKWAGQVTEIFHAEGAMVEVGSPIIAIDTDPDGEALPEPSAASLAAVEVAPAEGAVEPGLIGGPAPGGRTAVLVGYGPRTAAAKRRARKDSTPPADLAVTPAEEAPGTGVDQGAEPQDGQVREPGVGGPVLCKPPVRKLARDLGVDLRLLTGSGPLGSITREDVQSAASAQPATTPATVVPSFGPDRERRVAVKGVRRLTAENMVASAFTAPHVTEFLTVDMTRAMKALDRLRERREWRDVRVSPLLLVAKAVLLAVRRHPMVNSSWAGDEIVVKEYVNLGIAAATERGLIVPNIKDAHTLDLRQLAQALGELTGAARSGKTAPADLSGGTISITNIGVFGIDAGTPIINPGEAAILAMGAVRRQPWEYQGGIALRQVVTLSLSFDHRLVDGQQGATFLADVGTILAEPGMVLTMV